MPSRRCGKLGSLDILFSGFSILCNDAEGVRKENPSGYPAFCPGGQLFQVG